MRRSRRRALRALSAAAGILLLVGYAAELDARGGGRGGGGRGGGGMRGGGGISRGGPARGGSIRHEGSGGGYRSYERVFRIPEYRISNVIMRNEKHPTIVQ